MVIADAMVSYHLNSYIKDTTTKAISAYTTNSTYGLPFDLSFQKNFIFLQLISLRLIHI